MTRAFSVLSLVAALAIGGFMLTSQAAKNGQDKTVEKQAIDQAQATASVANFQQAAVALQAHQMESGTFAGTDMGGFGGVVLVRADTASYCLQAGTGATVTHLAGPGGTSAPGAC